jgi:hypothetical protein
MITCKSLKSLISLGYSHTITNSNTSKPSGYTFKFLCLHPRDLRDLRNFAGLPPRTPPLVSLDLFGHSTFVHFIHTAFFWHAFFTGKR